MSNAFEVWKVNFLAYLEIFSNELTLEIANKNQTVHFSLIGTALIYQAMRQQQRLVGGNDKEVINKSVAFVQAMATPRNEAYSLCEKALLNKAHQNPTSPSSNHAKEMNEVIATALSVTSNIDLGELQHIDAFVAWFALGVTYLVFDQGGDIANCEVGISTLIEELFDEAKTSPLTAGDMLKKHATDR